MEKTSNIADETDENNIENEMERYGIIRASIDVYHYKEFRYTNFSDALQQAKRDERAAKKQSK
ncbi:hypothetical protein [Amorphus sp. 3PC139-8]|uniref:hypothetical protein n=1 Tax=Amorphus sp. 3PC139-8 TaxID=2735676 RepID=UPI00345DD950